jgi:hypothetical protein
VVHWLKHIFYNAYITGVYHVILATLFFYHILIAQTMNRGFYLYNAMKAMACVGNRQSKLGNLKRFIQDIVKKKRQ